MNSRTIRIIGILGAIWNAVGVASYLAHVGMFGPEAAATPPGASAMPSLFLRATTMDGGGLPRRRSPDY